MNNQETGRFDRRKLLRLVGAGVLLAGAGGVGAYEAFRRQQRTEQVPRWSTNQEGILAKINELHFSPGSELQTTLFFRKMMWENAQLQKMEGTWSGSDESDWISHIDTIDKSVSSLAEAGFKGGRPVVVPFELTEDGKTYDWTPLESALGIMNKHNMVADLCVDPLDYPYGPVGIRVPRTFEHVIQQEVVNQGNNHLTVSLGQDPQAPEPSTAIRDYALNFLGRILEKYGKDTRVGKVYIGNEWPDTHLIEGVNATMSVGQDFMQEVVNMTMGLTDKDIALNTNIHPSNTGRLQTVFGPLFTILGSRGVLGIDAYPTQEARNSRLAHEVKRYGTDIRAVRDVFPQTGIVFTELQAEPWPPQGIAGRSWAEIDKNYTRQVMVPFYQQEFPPTLETYVINSGIKEIGLWGSEVWPLVAQMNYGFPLQMMTAIADSMRRST